MRVMALAAILAVASATAPAQDRFADYPLADYATGVVEKVVATVPRGAPRELAANETGPSDQGTSYRITIRDGGKTYDAQYTQKRKIDYPITLRPGEKVSYRVSEEERIWCQGTTMKMSRVPVLVLRDSAYGRWTLALRGDHQ